MYKRIVVAVDGSDHAVKAVEAAGALAHQFDAKLTICHVKQDGPIPDGLSQMLEAEHVVDPSIPPPNTALDVSGSLAARQRGSQTLERLRQVAAERLVAESKRSAMSLQVDNIDTRIDDGDPVAAILDCATGADADLIVMGRRGLSDLQGLVLGSVSHKVAARADCACLTVK